MIESLKSAFRHLQLPREARLARKADRSDGLSHDPGPEEVVRECAKWLCKAQDESVSGDGGVARDYSLVKGWATSYPETTGYIVPTMLHCGDYLEDTSYIERSKRMLDWLVSIQLEGGGFQGGKIDAMPIVPVTFNTGQILIGLAVASERFAQYRDPAIRAAKWLAESLDEDGCWRKFPTPFAAPGEKTYETHVSWGLFEAEARFPGMQFGEAGLKQVRWALKKQHSNGWLESCCLSEPGQPLTHTLGYALRGFIEAYHCRRSDELLNAAVLTARGLQSALGKDGFLPGRLRPDWSSAANWACLTGTVQIAHCWLLLYQHTGENSFLEAGRLANSYVRKTIKVTGNPNVRGGVKGSQPIDGDYGTYEYLNWAAKFCIDSNLVEIQLSQNT